MGKLQVLPAQLANMIAAGEVVGRPASVVKELMENAVDAGADNINVVITDSGRTLVSVIDNGCGMSPEDALLCFERHATSKISSPEDLNRILSFGFRGEALASIAAVAEISLRTRRQEDEIGTQVTVGAFDQKEQSACACPKGTAIEVHNLFYNTPARRKFLKSDNVEFKHIVEEFTHVALTRADISFSLKHNGRDVFVLKKARSRKFRIQDLLGQGVVGDVVDLDFKTSVVSISGFVGRPESAKKTLGNQFFFVNGRFFRSAYFHKAVMNAYAEMTPEGMTPSYILFLEVDPESVDVNISPTKTEVKFAEDSAIFQAIYACVRETLGRNSFGASLDFETEGAINIPQLGKSFAAYKPSAIAPSVDFDSSYNPFQSSDAQSSPFHGSPSQSYGALFEQTALPSQQTLTIGGKYLLTPVEGGLMAVNLFRARTRILYERMLKVLGGSDHFSQMSMFPVEVQIGAANMPIIEDNLELLTDLGFGIAPFGVDSISVSALPEGYSSDEVSVRECVAELLQILDEGTRQLPQVMQSNLARRFAELGAARYGIPKTTFEAARLLDELFSCENTELTPSGKRISVIINIEELDKKF